MLLHIKRKCFNDYTNNTHTNTIKRVNEIKIRNSLRNFSIENLDSSKIFCIFAP